MTMPYISGAELEEITKQKKENCIVVFSKESCTVCKQLKPIAEKVADAYENAPEPVKFYQMDVKTEDGLAAFKSMQLMGVPQCVFYKDGEFQQALPGALSESILKKEIDDMLHPKQGFFSKLKGMFK